MINNLSTISSTFSTSYIQEPLQGSHHRIQHSKLLALFHRFHHHLLQCQRLAFPWILLLAADINLAIVEAHFCYFWKFLEKNVEYIHIIRSISFGISMSPFSTFYHIWLSFLFKVGIYSQVFHWKYLNCLTNFKVSSTFADIALPFVSGTVEWWEILDQFEPNSSKFKTRYLDL